MYIFVSEQLTLAKLNLIHTRINHLDCNYHLANGVLSLMHSEVKLCNNAIGFSTNDDNSALVSTTGYNFKHVSVQCADVL